MILDQETLRFIFGLKLRSLREGKELSLKSLARLSGLSPSYINEIEKGKKYPKTEKILLLAKALDANYEDLVSLKLTTELSNISDILANNLLQKLPFEQFGIPARNVFEQMAEKPMEFAALISSVLELTRNYKIHLEDFLFSALRAHIDMRNNYFPEIEEHVEQFKTQFKLSHENESLENFLKPASLKAFLEEKYSYQVIISDFRNFPSELHDLFYFFVHGKNPHFYINQNLSARETTFVLIKEIAHAYLKLNERLSHSHVSNIENFQQVYNNFQSAYFASALLIPRTPFIEEVKTFFANEVWNPQAFTEWTQKYPGTYESFFHRLSQILPTFFEIDQMFYLRFHYNSVNKDYSLIKELHLSELHSPHIVKTGEHYCRRWITATLPQSLTKEHKPILSGIQRSLFWTSSKEYICIAQAFPLELKPTNACCITLGILNSDKTREKIRFFKDQSIPQNHISSTCQQCGIFNCDVRIAPSRVVEESTQDEKIAHAIQAVIEVEESI